MARPTRFKVKKGDRWVDLDDWRDEINAPQPAPEFPSLDLGSLPDRAELDDEMPFEQLFFEHPSIRPYVYLTLDDQTGKRTMHIRSGIPPEYRAVALDILRKYGCMKEEHAHAS